MSDPDRIAAIQTILSHEYPAAKIALFYHSPWELLVAVILSAQCTDTMVNTVTEKLFRKYPTFEDYLKVDKTIFESDIKSTGFYHNKAKNILAAAKKIKDEFHGEVPRTMEAILTLPGVARKTANVVLGNAYGEIAGIAVDTHVIRLSQRLRLVDLTKIGGKHSLYVQKTGQGTISNKQSCEVDNKQETINVSHITSHVSRLIDFIKDADPVKIERELMEAIPKKNWFTITYQLIDHGRALCKAQHPKCGACPLSQYCPAKRA